MAVDRAAEPRTGAGGSVADRLLGLVGGAMILAAVFLLFAGGPEDGAPEGAAAAPAIVVVEPAEGARAGTRVPVVFHLDEELTRMPGGWGTGELHLHGAVDGVEFMPGPRDIQRISSGRYRWVFGPLAPGPHSIRLFWSDAAHRPLAEGGAPPVQVRVE